MSIVTMQQAQSWFLQLVEAVASGQEQEIVIARDGKPAARLVPLETKKTGVKLGVAKGAFTVPTSIDEGSTTVATLFGTVQSP
jgi:antitoxin (DNA-binding transcriptional repressor) of toxin-antitoxin stability system